ncbi:type VII secretion protein EccB [Mycolicibacterium conceptionense]|uniref:type VII secretion protein EccB n=1 Tax=Mycolicibacterium conceptionense TaxID=451644 RepID=UPI0032047532
MAENEAGGSGRPERAPDRYRGLLTTWKQVTAYSWLRSRTGYALTLRRVSTHFDLAAWIRRMPWAMAVVWVLAIVGAFVFGVIRPAGVVGDSRIVADRSSYELYVDPGDGRLRPVLNLTSARLIVGAYQEPTGVSHESIESKPKGLPVGIAGAPGAMNVTNGSGTSVGVCQRVAVNSVAGKAVITVINGGVQVGGGRNAELAPSQAVVGSMDGQTFLIWNGVKSAFDPADRIVLSALGIDRVVAAAPMPLSGAVGNAIPSGLPLVVPSIPDAGIPAPWKLGVAGLPVGAVVRSETPGRGTEFFVVLKDGVQKVAATVAAMLRSQNAYGLATPPVVSPDALAVVPQVTVVQASQFPPEPVQVVDPTSKPVTCWLWEKGRTSTAAAARVVVGTELPISAAADNALVAVGSSGKGADGADFVSMAPDAANYVAVTGNSATSATKEAMWWLSTSGTRFGLSTNQQERTSVGLGDDALPMPYSILRLFPRGLPENVALTKTDAMTEHRRVPVDPAAGAVLPPAGGN